MPGKSCRSVPQKGEKKQQANDRRKSGNQTFPGNVARRPAEEMSEKFRDVKRGSARDR